MFMKLLAVVWLISSCWLTAYPPDGVGQTGLTGFVIYVLGFIAGAVIGEEGARNKTESE